MNGLRQAWPAPSAPRPVVIIGAGAIVRSAHLPAYRRVGFPVAGLFDVRPDAAAATAREFGVARVFGTIEEACAAPGVIFDVAVPGGETARVIDRLPRGSAVLIQKPMGEDLSAARRIRALCHERELVAAMNFQLRFSPNVMAVTDLVCQHRLGDLTDIEVRVVDRQPWERWQFLEGAPRLEILYHSIHYLDAIRWLAGEPRGVLCRAVGHPSMTRFGDTSSTIILDYGDRIRCSLVMNHTHRQDGSRRASMLKIEGTAGAATLTLGVNLEYPTGVPDTLDVALDGGWQTVPLRGSWFPQAFEGPMSNLQRFVAREDHALVSPVDDAVKTMALVEACYVSSAGPSTPIPAVD
jgi:predicted dehydrogenase